MKKENCDYGLGTLVFRQCFKNAFFIFYILQRHSKGWSHFNFNFFFAALTRCKRGQDSNPAAGESGEKKVKVEMTPTLGLSLKNKKMKEAFLKH
jgi:hypothetical protein